MSIIYALVGTYRVLSHSNYNNSIVIGDFNSFRVFWDTLYNSSTHSLKPKQKGEIKINKNNTPPTSNNHREISEIASVNKDRFKDGQTQLVVSDSKVPSNTLSNVKKIKAHKIRSKIVSLPPNWLGNLPLIDLPSPINRTVEGSHSHVDERPNYFSRYGRKRRPPGWQVYLNFVSRHTQNVSET
jgi:hypothetical protein